MYKIMKAEKLADKIFLMDVHAPRVASHCEPQSSEYEKTYDLEGIYTRSFLNIEKPFQHQRHSAGSDGTGCAGAGMCFKSSVGNRTAYINPGSS